jgi:hypothetical protein
MPDWEAKNMRPTVPGGSPKHGILRCHAPTLRVVLRPTFNHIEAGPVNLSDV